MNSLLLLGHRKGHGNGSITRLLVTRTLLLVSPTMVYFSGIKKIALRWTLPRASGTMRIAMNSENLFVRSLLQINN